MTLPVPLQLETMQATGQRGESRTLKIAVYRESEGLHSLILKFLVCMRLVCVYVYICMFVCAHTCIFLSETTGGKDRYAPNIFPIT